MLVFYFQSFPESLQYNQDSGQFEVVSGEAQSVSRNIRLGLLNLLSSSDPNELAKTPLIDNEYTVCVSKNFCNKLVDIYVVRWVLSYFIEICVHFL